MRVLGLLGVQFVDLRARDVASWHALEAPGLHAQILGYQIRVTSALMVHSGPHGWVTRWEDLGLDDSDELVLVVDQLLETVDPDKYELVVVLAADVAQALLDQGLAISDSGDATEVKYLGSGT